MSAKSQIGALLRRVLPAPAYRGLEVRYGRRHAIRWLRKQNVIDLDLEVAGRFDYTVQSGPFQGMRYTHRAVLTRHSTPSLLGTYEHQLYPFLIEAAIRCESVIDIGSAEGYFAVGLARLTGKPVAAFDANGNEREILREMARLNDVSHLVKISRWCSGENLIELVRARRALVFCDIDGGEFSLFTPQVIQELRGCDVFIELHGSPEENREFIQRFRERTPAVLDHPREIAGAERLHFLGTDAMRIATEYRPFQQWLVARPLDIVSLEQLERNAGKPAVHVASPKVAEEARQLTD